VSSAQEPVLLIDDHDDGRLLLRELLALEGYEVVMCRNGHDTLHSIDALRPCLIFLDLGLPDMSGLELARLLRARPTLAGTPLYALSGFSHLRQQALDAGCDGFVLKPVLPAQLRRIVGAHCRRDPEKEKVA
jgi:CheY-like chemotaxis protein